MLQILDVNPIKWINPDTPYDKEKLFCMLCREETATVKLKFRLRKAIGTMVVCPKCATMPAHEIHEIIRE